MQAVLLSCQDEDIEKCDFNKSYLQWMQTEIVIIIYT